MPTISKPMLFSAPMVRAILDGRKTQTRRVVKTSAENPSEIEVVSHLPEDPENMWCVVSTSQPKEWIKGPHPAGSEIWVKEAWCAKCDENGLMWNEDQNTYQVWYKASNPEVMAMGEDGFMRERADGTEASPWKSPIFMPRWASRITLTVESVRAERLQDITETDAISEGCCNAYHPDFHVGEYRDLWNTINGPGSWDLNPWVFVYTFKITDKEQAR